MDWNSIEDDPRFGSVLAAALKSIGINGENLLTPKGEEFLLSQYEWTRLAKLTKSQAREARLQLLLACQDSWHDLEFLLQRFHEEELYSSNTSDRHIRKGIPKLIVAAKKLLDEE